MRRILGALLCALSLLASASVPASAGDYPVVGRIAATYTAAGGEAVLGSPTEAEVKLALSGRNLYHQRMAKGLVFWSSYVGGKTATWPGMLTLSGVSNERDALARSGLKPGMVFRSAKLCGATGKDRQLMLAQLHGGSIIDLRTSGAASSCPDPSIGVTRVRYSVSSDAVYPRYVTDSARRASFAKAIRAILANAERGAGSWIHCTAGKDRTGWTITILLSILGADQADIYAEYLRSSGADEADLVDGLDQVATSYGGVFEHGVTGAGMYRYVTKGLGITDAEIDALRTALR